MVKCDVNRQSQARVDSSTDSNTGGVGNIVNFFVNIQKSYLTPKTQSLHTKFGVFPLSGGEEGRVLMI